MSLTNLLIAVNVVAFIWLTTTGGLDSNPALFRHGALLGEACTQLGQWWRIITGGFLHGGLVHIALNMFALFQVGNVVEQMYGRVRFALLYFVALIGSGLAVVYVAPTSLTVGASGAIFGLFGALVAVGIRMGPQGRGLIGQVLPVIVINLIFTFTIPNISAAGHVGGLVTGFLAGLVFYMMPRRRGYAYVYAGAPDERAPVETIEHPPAAAPHESEDAPPLEVRDPRE